MNYSVKNASARDSVALFMSIPENFDVKKDLYTSSEGSQEMEYVFKGMVVYNGGHYMTYIRNLKTKLAFVIDYKEMDKEIYKIRRELSEETEWTLHNDCEVSSVTGNWK